MDKKPSPYAPVLWFVILMSLIFIIAKLLGKW